jgi:hypothetical protein
MTASTPTTPTTSSALLAEDLLMLLFRPTDGVFRGEGSPLFHVLAGAVLTDLAAGGWVEIDEHTSLRGRQVRALAGGAPDRSAPLDPLREPSFDAPADPLLRETWERISRKPTDVYSLILEIGPHLRAPMIERLEERGHIRTEARKLLGFIPNTTIIDGGTPRRAELLAAVRAVLVDGAEPDTRTAALVALLSASGEIATMHLDIPWSGAVHTRSTQIRKGDWGAAAAGEAVARTAAAILSNSLFVTVTLPAIRRD